MGHAKSTNPNEFILPDLGEGVHEAELIAWKVEPGQTVAEHEILAEMETDKALVEVPSPRAGTIKQLHGEEGEILHVGNVLVTYEGGADDAPVASADASKNGSASAAASEEREDAGTVVGSVAGGVGGIGTGKVLATPAVRRLARDLGVDLSVVAGTGIGGRVMDRDVRAAAEGGGAAPKKSAAQPQAKPAAPVSKPAAPSAPAWSQPQGFAPPAPQQAPMPMQGAYPAPQYAAQYPPQQAAPGYGMPMMWPMPFPMPMFMPPYGMPGMGGGGVPHAPGYTPSTIRSVPDPAQRAVVEPGQGAASIPFRGVRRTIAQRLRQSVDTSVHFTVMDDADVTAIDAMRRELSQASGVKISFLPFACVAVCKALASRFGALNATVDEDNAEINQHASVHLGIATDTDSGLMVPVIRDAHALGIVDMQQAINAAAGSARDRSAPREALQGSTFTISNVGSHAGKYATPVINAPEVAILAVGRVFDGVVVRDGQAAVGKIMPLSLACDHRVVDGATAALALAEITQMLGSPESLFG